MAIKKNKNLELIVAIVFAGLVIAGSVVFFALEGRMSDEDLAKKISQGIEAYVAGANGSEPSAVDMDELVDDQPFVGDEDAPVTITEFSDYLCGYCQLFFNETEELLFKNYVETGKVKFVYRDFLLGYSGDYEAAMVAECARDQDGDEGFFKMHDYIFQTVHEGFDLEKYVSFADQMGLDGDELRECVTDEDFKDEINKDVDYGHKLGIRGTPGFFINDTFAPGGAMPYEEFERLIEAELKK